MQDKLLEIIKKEGFELGFYLEREYKSKINFKTAHWQIMPSSQLEAEAIDYANEQVRTQLMIDCINRYGNDYMPSDTLRRQVFAYIGN